jgi:hypothetical protein
VLRGGHGGEHGGGVLSCEGERRGRYSVPGVMAIITHLMAQKTMVGRGHGR